MNTKTAIAAAILSPEAGVAEPKRAKLSSFAAQILDLEPGQCASRVVQVPSDTPLSELRSLMSTMRDNLRNNVAPARARAADKLKAEFSTEVTDFMTPAAVLYVVAIVTRVS